jgi:hypothetical protein
MNKTTASNYAKRMKALYPDCNVWLSRNPMSEGYSVSITFADNTYETLYRDEEACEDFLRIHA